MLVDNMLAPTERCVIKPDHKYDKLNLLFILYIWFITDWTYEQTVGTLVESRDMGIPMWKVVLGLITQWEKMYIVGQFRAAKDAIMTATVDGNLDDNGFQFAGQCQGLITEIPAVDKLVHK